jgi:hypothetical protein
VAAIPAQKSAVPSTQAHRVPARAKTVASRMPSTLAAHDAQLSVASSRDNPVIHRLFEAMSQRSIIE